MNEIKQKFHPVMLSVNISLKFGEILFQLCFRQAALTWTVVQQSVVQQSGPWYSSQAHIHRPVLCSKIQTRHL